MSCHNNSVTLGIYDSDSSDVNISQMKRQGIYMETACIVHNASSTLQILASAVRMSGYPVQKIKLRLFDTYIDNQPCNIEKTDLFWAELPCSPELSVQQLRTGHDWTDSKPIISVTQSDGWHLKMVDHRFSLDGSSWLLSSFDKVSYGALRDHVRNKEFRSVVLQRVHGLDNFLESDLNLRANNLERLELFNVVVGDFWPQNTRQAVALKFLTSLQRFVGLQTLVLEKVVDRSVSDITYWIQKERVEWNGYAEIQAGLNVLIAKAKARYP